MKNIFTCLLNRLLLSAFFLLWSFTSFGSHIISARLSYAYVSGSTYKVTLTVYANCGPASGGAFATLPYSTPHICIYDGSTSIDSMGLIVQPPDTGVDATPLCPGGVSTCTDPASTIPGIQKFVYSANYTLPYTSATWRFIYNGGMGSGASAGRAAAITNLTAPGSSIIQLEDTLNNTVYNNSSPVINSVAFEFPVNQYDNFNPLSTDPDGDNLSYSLIAPRNGDGATACIIGATLPYIAGGLSWPGQPLSGPTPLQNVLSGSFHFDNTSGVLAFYPMVLQRSIVVYNIREYRSGVLVGTSQIEYSFIVSSPTSGISPYITTPWVGAATFSSGCGSVPDTVTVGGYSSGCGISGLQWQSSPDDITWTNIGGATTNIYTYTYASPLYYRCFEVNSILGDTAYGASVYALASAAGLMHWSVNTLCDSSDFQITACDTSSFYVATTYFGDGSSATTPLSLSGGICSASILHEYATPGTFMVKQVLSISGFSVDSVTYPYDYFYCRTLQAKFYLDVDSDCVFTDTIDFYNYYPLTVEIDSNGIPLDTVSATSGLYYTALGGPGTIYSFKVLSLAPGFYVSCPLSAILSDTISSSVSSYPTQYFGLKDTATITGFDIVNSTSLTCSPLAACGSILVYNLTPVVVPGVVTMTFSTKYIFDSSLPAPTSVVGNTITWNVGPLSSPGAMTLIDFHLIDSGAIPVPIGDSIQANTIASPLVGDIDTTNNTCGLMPVVLSGYDPNFIQVSPQGHILTGTQLQYIIHFENTGNDTAHNIFVMDTLSQYLNPHTLTLVGASAPMNVWSYNNGLNDVVKFDFPNIDLPDSSHHNMCDGMLVFNIKTKDGLPDGTTIFNHAGIFFDYNPVVMTNSVEDIIGFSTTSATDLRPSSSVQIFPNPAADELTIKMTENAFTSFTITNSIGQQMIRQTLTGTQAEVNISMLPAGVYYITFRGTNGTEVRKFVKS